MQRSLQWLVLVVLTASTADAGVRSFIDLPDLAVRAMGDSVQVFVVLPGRGGLVEGRVAPEAGSTPVRELRPFRSCGDFRRPVAVAVRESRLLVVDLGDRPTIVECDLARPAPRVLFSGEPLRAPSSVAIARDGRVAVVDRELRGVFTIDPAGKIDLQRGIGTPLLVRADDLNNLYLLDADAGGIVPFEARAGETDSNEQIYRARKGAGTLLPLPPEASSFAVFRDVFYVADGSALRVMLPSSRLSLGISDARAHPALVALTEWFLVMMDREVSSLELVQRPLPAGVVLDHLSENPNLAWVDLLTHVAERTLLPSKSVQLAPGETSYEDVLAHHGVLLRADTDQEKLAIQPGTTRGLFCALNRQHCESGFPSGAAAIRVPDASAEPTLAAETRSLDGRSAREWIDERVVIAAQKREVTDGYLARYNPDATSSLDAELRRRNMVMATPMSPVLTAGTVVRIENGRETVAGPLKEICGIDLEPNVGRTTLPSHLSVPRAALPGEREKSLSGSTDRVDMTVGAWRRETLSVSALLGCQPSRDTKNLFVIVEALGAMQVRFAAPRGGSRNTPTERLLEGPLYVGYKPVSVAGLALGVSTPPPDIERLKPAKPSSALLDQRSGALVLPLTRWRAELLLPAAEYYDARSPLAELRKRHPGLDLSPHERLRLSALANDHVHVLPPSEDLRAVITNSQETLLNTIGYDRDLADASGAEAAYVGIIERSTSVNTGHPGFYDSDLQSAWYEYVPDVGLRRHPALTAPASPIAATARRVVAEVEHGTHVAGIVAARPGSLVQGFLPSVNLFLVPSDSMDRLRSNIERAREGEVFIFNMSLGFPAGSESVVQDLRRYVGRAWSRSLFVVAAGNGGEDMNAMGAPAPVVWALSASNVLTVGASDETGEHVLSDHRDPDEPKPSKGSSYGSMYVDLVAPGRMVYSLGTDGYAFACGSSQAAPQVTAAAAMLWSNLRTPEELKARLLYTADWKSDFAGKVWAGLLNVRRAVFFPRTNLLTMTSENDPHEIVFEGGARFTIDGIEMRRDGSEQNFAAAVPVSRILRMTELGGGQYRVLFINNGVLTIVEGRVSGRARCTSLTHLDQSHIGFGANPHPKSICQAGIEAGEIADYVAATPSAIRFH